MAQRDTKVSELCLELVLVRKRVFSAKTNIVFDQRDMVFCSD